MKQENYFGCTDSHAKDDLSSGMGEMLSALDDENDFVHLNTGNEYELLDQILRIVNRTAII